ncbi:MAG: hypothetical protein NDJ89_11250 [Oligoflexia bacterium]|nr:hypothetical protein [Oligoflexia bacterium]
MRSREIVMSELKSAVRQERECALRVLHLLQEVEADRHYLELGFPSLFEFATRELGYSPGAAMRRIQAMRLLKAMPEVEAKIKEGSLSLCVASKTQSFSANASRSLPRSHLNRLCLGNASDRSATEKS